MGKIDIGLILENGKNNKHDEVVKCFKMLDEQDKLNEMVMMAYADSLYELGDDVASLDAYLNFVMQHAESKAVDVALFGAAVALKNLDLQDEAANILTLIHPEHNGLDEEIEHSRRLLSEQTKARAMLGKYWKTLKALKGPPISRPKSSE